MYVGLNDNVKSYSSWCIKDKSSMELQSCPSSNTFSHPLKHIVCSLSILVLHVWQLFSASAIRSTVTILVAFSCQRTWTSKSKSKFNTIVLLQQHRCNATLAAISQLQSCAFSGNWREIFIWGCSKCLPLHSLHTTNLSPVRSTSCRQCSWKTTTVPLAACRTSLPPVMCHLFPSFVSILPI